MVHIILKGEPKSTNNCYGVMCRGRFPNRYMTTGGKKIKTSYVEQLHKQWKDPITDRPVSLDVKIYFGTKRKQDIDNFNKILFDSMTGIVWVDDSQVYKVAIEKFYDKENPRIEVAVDN